MPVSSSLMSPRVEFSLLSLEDLVVLGLSVGSGSPDPLMAWSDPEIRAIGILAVKIL